MPLLLGYANLATTRHYSKGSAVRQNQTPEPLLIASTEGAAGEDVVPLRH